MLSNAHFLANIRFDTAVNEAAKNLQNVLQFCSRGARGDAGLEQLHGRDLRGRGPGDRRAPGRPRAAERPLPRGLLRG